jgi:hypothetical protein
MLSRKSKYQPVRWKLAKLRLLDFFVVYEPYFGNRDVSVTTVDFLKPLLIFLRQMSETVGSSFIPVQHVGKGERQTFQMDQGSNSNQKTATSAEYG